jgi:hypothetical protein
MMKLCIKKLTVYRNCRVAELYEFGVDPLTNWRSDYKALKTTIRSTECLGASSSDRRGRSPIGENNPL